MIRIAIVDDHPVVRAGLKQFLSDQSDMSVVAEASSGRAALDIVRSCGWRGCDADGHFYA